MIYLTRNEQYLPAFKEAVDTYAIPSAAAPTFLWFKNLKSDKSNFEDAILDNSDLVGHLRRNEAIHVRGAIMNTGNLRDQL